MRLIDADKIRYKDLNGDMPNSNIHVWITFLDWIKEMPTVEERKTGKWIVYKAPDKYHCGLCKCPFCGEEMIAESDEYNYCPNCGARMEGGQDE